MNKKIPFPLAILIILLVIAVIIVVAFWLCPEEKTIPPQERTIDWKICSADSDCVVFGKDGDCNCGCFNKNYTDWQAGGVCFCATPTSCRCINSRCEGVFLEDETADWQTYRNEEYEFEFKYPAYLELQPPYISPTGNRREINFRDEEEKYTLTLFIDSNIYNWENLEDCCQPCGDVRKTNIGGIEVANFGNTMYFFSKDKNFVYTIQFTDRNSAESSIVICEKILSTFSFTEAIGPEVIQLEIKDFTTDKETYTSNEELRASLMILTSGDIEGAVVNLVGIKPSNYAYINSSQTIDLISGENEIIFTATTPHCTSGCGGVYPGPYDLSAEVFIEDNLIVSSTTSINLTNN